MKIPHLQITHLASSHAVANIQTSLSPSQSLSIATRSRSNSEASAEPTPVSMAQIHINALSANIQPQLCNLHSTRRNNSIHTRLPICFCPAAVAHIAPQRQLRRCRFSPPYSHTLPNTTPHPPGGGGGCSAHVCLRRTRCGVRNNPRVRKYTSFRMYVFREKE
jgi:hypothetical protein